MIQLLYDTLGLHTIQSNTKAPWINSSSDTLKKKWNQKKFFKEILKTKDDYLNKE